MESDISDEDYDESAVNQRVQEVIENALGTGDNRMDGDLTNDQDPYESFMRKHLEHYGYYTGRNASFRDGFQNFNEWQQNYDVRLSGTHDLTPADEATLKKNNNVKVNDQGTMFSGEGEVSDELLRRTTQLVFNYQAGRKIPRLREPRNLYALTKEPGPQQATRWPQHVQVVCPSIKFISYRPPAPEPFYEPTGKEATPAVRSPQQGELIYYNDPGRDCYFMRSRVAGCRGVSLDAVLTPRPSTDDVATLEFESRFESGNLLKANKITPFDYELTLRTDLYTDRHTQWFFFRVRNMVPGRQYRFTVVNLMKPSSLYNHGMKPVFYSEVEAKKNKVGWLRRGSDIRYYRNNLGSMSGRTFYSLTWTHTFDHESDTCYFAHCYPYTYTDLQEYLNMLANDPVRSKFCKQRVLTRTLAGNLVYVLTITYPAPNPEIARTKKAIVITARVHPGETNASWMMKGFLDFLTGNSADAKLLRETFIFKIIPMLNPDGVIVGNYRCSLSGRDLNRNYKSVLKDSFPSVYHAKMMIKKLVMQREVVLYCDLHGHSRKNNIFIYGCENKNNPQKKFRERIFPLMLSKNANTSFSYESCKFKVQRSKEGTGRVVMWYMGIMNSYTMEATFGGTSLGSRKGTHFSTYDLELMGHNFCDTILDYCDPDSSKAEACYIEIQERMRKQLMKRLQNKNIDVSTVDLDDYTSDLESDTSGSDSSCDDSLPVHLLAIAPKLQRRRKLKSRRDRNKQQVRKTSAPPIPAPEETKPIAKSASEKNKVQSRYSNPSSRKDNRNSANAASMHNYGENRLEKASKKLPPSVLTVQYFQPVMGMIRFSNFGRPLTTSRTDYLEALTNAYIRGGVLEPDPAKASLRYSNNNQSGGDAANFTVSYLASHLNDFTAEEQYQILKRSALRKQLSPAQQRQLARSHLVAVAAMQQRKDELSRQAVLQSESPPEIRRIKSAVKQHPNPFDEMSEQALPRSASAHSQIRSRTNDQSQHSRADTATNQMPPPDFPSTNSREPTIDQSECDVESNDQKMFNYVTAERTLAPENPTENKKLIQGFFMNKNESKTKNNSQEADNSSSSQQQNNTPGHAPGHLPESQSMKYSKDHGQSLQGHTETSQDFTKYLVKKVGDLKVPETFVAFEDESLASEQKATNGKTETQNQKATKQHRHKEKKLEDQNFRSEPNHSSPKETTGQHKARSRVSPNSTNISSEIIPAVGDAEHTRPPPAAMKQASLNSITQGHSNRYRAKNYVSEDGDSFFGMSDKLNIETNMKHNSRVPPVVANIAELRRALMGTPESTEDDKPTHKHHHHHHTRGTDKTKKQTNDEIKVWSERNMRNPQNVNLRPKVPFRNEEPNDDAAKTLDTKRKNLDTYEKTDGSFTSKEHDHRVTDQQRHHHHHHSKTLQESSHHHHKKKSHYEIGEAKHVINSSSDFEEYIEEKWPVTNELEMQSYTQGNATIEKMKDTSMTNIRIGARVSDYFRTSEIQLVRPNERGRLSEGWIDLHQRTRENFQMPKRTDKLQMSNVSLNIENDKPEERPTNNVTPALAKRPVPPMLRYLSAKQNHSKRK